MGMHGRSRAPGSHAGAHVSPRVAGLLAAVLAAASLTACATTEGVAAGRGFSSVTLGVPTGNGEAPFNVQRSLTIPSGWSAEVWSRVADARFATWTPQGDLLVSSSQAGKVIELIPGAAGSAPAQKVLISGLTSPQGLAFDTLEGARVLYVAESNQVDRYVWKENGTVGVRTIVVRNLPDTSGTGDDVHRPKSIAIASNHTIYVTVGSASNATPDEPGESPPRATILSFQPNGSSLQVFASGVRNGEGLAFAPDGSLWTAVNERDEVPYPYHQVYGAQPEAYGKVIPAYVDEHPPDELARLTAGRNLGWPYCDPNPDVHPGEAGTKLRFGNLPFVADTDTNAGESVLNCKTLAPIERGIPAHSAPLGFNFLEGSALKGRFSHGAVLAVHGSWDRTPPRAPAVLWLAWQKQKQKQMLGEALTLVGGFQETSGSRWGRPTDAVPGPDGALYVTDDTAGAVYRIAPKQHKGHQ